MKGLDIPPSFRDECGCCQGQGTHEGCTPVNRINCDGCDGTGWQLNRLGRDFLRFLEAAGAIHEGSVLVQ